VIRITFAFPANLYHFQGLAGRFRPAVVGFTWGMIFGIVLMASLGSPFRLKETAWVSSILPLQRFAP
jgi:hypothetical protein